jgi:hypothetical protein
VRHAEQVEGAQDAQLIAGVEEESSIAAQGGWIAHGAR